ncbi:MAG: hypothetical protein ACN4E2_03240 [Nitrospinota bacterium]
MISKQREYKIKKELFIWNPVRLVEFANRQDAPVTIYDNDGPIATVTPCRKEMTPSNQLVASNESSLVEEHAKSLPVASELIKNLEEENISNNRADSKRRHRLFRFAKSRLFTVLKAS